MQLKTARDTVSCLGPYNYLNYDKRIGWENVIQLSHEILFQARPRSSMTRIEGVQIQGQRRNIEIDKTGCKG